MDDDFYKLIYKMRDQAIDNFVYFLAFKGIGQHDHIRRKIAVTEYCNIIQSQLIDYTEWAELHDKDNSRGNDDRNVANE